MRGRFRAGAGAGGVGAGAGAATAAAFAAAFAAAAATRAAATAAAATAGLSTKTFNHRCLNSGNSASSTMSFFRLVVSLPFIKDRNCKATARLVKQTHDTAIKSNTNLVRGEPTLGFLGHP